jgi:hypothetical protein
MNILNSTARIVAQVGEIAKWVWRRDRASAKSHRANKFAATHGNADLRRRQFKRRRSLSRCVEAVSTAESSDLATALTVKFNFTVSQTRFRVIIAPKALGKFSICPTVEAKWTC